MGIAPLAEFPYLGDLPTLVRLKYLTATNRWTALVPGTASTLLTATGWDPSRSRVWRELLAGYGITDIASLVFGDQFGCWGWLDLWRSTGPFTPDEADLLGGLDRLVSPALRRSLAATFTSPPTAPNRGAEPVALILTEDLQPMTHTPLVDTHLRALLPTDADRAPIPAAAYNVAAQLLARERHIDDHPPSARTHLGDGAWVTVSAARLVPSPTGTTGIAVSIEPTTGTARAELFARVIGLSDRESELLRHLVVGSDT
ncbi:MAG: hypothetical protein WCF36_03635 [Candidatus Nanopelagicales bacterium]